MLPALLALLGFGIVVQRQVRHLFAGRALALFQHVKTGLHILTEFAELLGQPFHHRSAVLAVGGLLIGFGARLGGGCTSGHGICGMASLSVGSMWMVAVFLSTAIVTALLMNALGVV